MPSKMVYVHALEHANVLVTGEYIVSNLQTELIACHLDASKFSPPTNDPNPNLFGSDNTCVLKTDPDTPALPVYVSVGQKDKANE
jgi:hypothetical protein